MYKIRIYRIRMMITNGYLAHKWKHGKLMLLTSATNHLAHSYDFTYDGLHRMTDAVYDDASGGRNRYNETVSYNANSSALTIKRNGRNDAGNYTAIDNLTLMYRGNRLLKVTDKGDACTATGATDFNDGASITVEYTYDACGARTSDANKGIASIRYSYWGTPELIQFTNGSQTRYVYDASGVKQKRIHITAVDNIVVPLKTVMELSDDQILTSDTTEYSGNLVFENGRLDKVLFSSGYVSCNDNAANRFTFHYFVKDHLGNNRAVVNENGAIEQTTHYYPFGNSIADIGTNTSIQQYKYNGKELDRMHGLDWYDYGARNYDPVILQWDRPDPLADKYYPVSPYVYCVDNPVRFIDIDGMDWYQSETSLYYTWFPGSGFRNGYRHIGGKGSVLGEFEGIIDGLLQDTYGRGSLYSNGFTFDITPNDKGALVGSKERDYSLFDEFANGTGPDVSVFLSDHPYTKDLRKNPKISEAQLSIKAGKSDVPGQYTEGKKDWGLLDVITSFSVAEQFVGSYRFDIFTSKDGKHFNNVVSDSKSLSSLLYHLYPPQWNIDRRKQKELGNTYQFYIWKSKK